MPEDRGLHITWSPMLGRWLLWYGDEAVGSVSEADARILSV